MQLESHENIIAIIFDFDGVLVDSLEAHLAAWKKTIVDLFKTDPGDVTWMIGHSTSVIARKLIEKYGPIKDRHEVIQYKKELMRSDLIEVPILPGARELHSYLEKYNFPKAVCSNAPRNYVRRTLKSLALEFKIANGYEDFSKPKPSPIPYIETAQALGFKKADFPRIVVFEDSLHGLKAAVEAGMHAIGITTSQSSDSLRKAGAKATYQNLAEFLDTVSKTND